MDFQAFHHEAAEEDVEDSEVEEEAVEIEVDAVDLEEEEAAVVDAEEVNSLNKNECFSGTLETKFYKKH